MAVFNENRTFGVEIEVNTRKSQTEVVLDLNRSLSAAGLPPTAYAANWLSHDAPRGWKVTSDGSVSRGWEIVSPILSGFNGLAQLEAICNAMPEPDYSVDRSTGLHIHHSIAGLNGQQVGNAFGIYWAYQTVLNYLVAPSRRGYQNYTKPIPDSSVRDSHEFKSMTKRQATDKIKAGMGCHHRAACRCSARYHSVNPLSILTQDTIEFRQHQGTTSYTKISNWILLTQSIIEAGRFTKKFPKPSIIRRDINKASGNFYRLKGATQYTPQGNPHHSPSQCEPYQKMWKYYNKIIAKFAARDGLSVSEIK
jgi:hypothetical protein